MPFLLRLAPVLAAASLKLNTFKYRAEEAKSVLQVAQIQFLRRCDMSWHLGGESHFRKTCSSTKAKRQEKMKQIWQT